MMLELVEKRYAECEGAKARELEGAVIEIDVSLSIAKNEIVAAAGGAVHRLKYMNNKKNMNDNKEQERRVRGWMREGIREETRGKE